MPWSKYQTAIFDDIRERAGSLNVNAVAGSGKTTTLIECAHQHPLGTGKVLAFNRIIAQELARRLPERFDAQTFNAAGFREIRQRVRDVRVDGRKLFFIMRDDDRFAHTQGTDKYELRQSLRSLVDLMKANAFGIGGDFDHDMLATLVDNKELDTTPLTLNDFIDTATDLFEASVQELSLIDFSDQLYLPIYRDWRFDQWPVVFADEAQDLSPIQHLMLLRMTDTIVAFGDPHQAIYAFRGADTNSMNNLAVASGAPELPLSLSYRCPKDIVREAQRYVPHIEAFSENPSGNVNHHTISGLEQLMTEASLDSRHLVLCRNNKPLMRLALAMLRARRPFNILNDFPEKLKHFVKSFEADTMQKLRVRLEAWHEEQREVYANRTGRLAAVADKYESIKFFVEECDDIGGILSALEEMSRNETGPRLSTIHKAKGTEAQHVYILAPELMPSRFARSKEALQQEDNLAYVAVTRSLDALSYCYFR